MPVAGCLELLPHCMPIFANHNAFRRYGAMVNAASRASWGYEDRDACIRIPNRTVKPAHRTPPRRRRCQPPLFSPRF